jgi:hypothetical protein
MLPWKLSADFVRSRGGSSSAEQAALDTDFKYCALPALPENVGATRQGHLGAALILQLVGVKNVSVQPAKGASDRVGLASESVVSGVYKAQFTDGHKRVYGVQADEKAGPVRIDTPPGTKFFFPVTTAIRGGFLWLDRSVRLLGGAVEELVDRWKTQCELDYHQRATVGNNDGRPAFLPFTKV